MTYKWNTLYLNSTSSTLKRVKRKELKVITTPLYILSAFDETVRESQPHRDCGDLIGGPWDAANAAEHHHSVLSRYPAVPAVTEVFKHKYASKNEIEAYGLTRLIIRDFQAFLVPTQAETAMGPPLRV
jgi:hypothetical protein